MLSYLVLAVSLVRVFEELDVGSVPWSVVPIRPPDHEDATLRTCIAVSGEMQVCGV